MAVADGPAWRDSTRRHLWPTDALSVRPHHVLFQATTAVAGLSTFSASPTDSCVRHFLDNTLITIATSPPRKTISIAPLYPRLWAPIQFDSTAHPPPPAQHPAKPLIIASHPPSTTSPPRPPADKHLQYLGIEEVIHWRRRLISST